MPVLGPNIALGAHARGKGGGVPAPAIVLSATSIAEDAEIGSVVATLSVSGLPDGVTVTGYTITVDPDDVFDISTASLITTAALDYETATSHAYTIEAALSVGGPVTRSGVISVTNVFEEPDLVALTLDADEIVSGSEEDTVVGAVVGQTSGSTLALVDDAGGRLKLSGGQILAGATATDYDTATSHNITLRETLADSSNSPRDSVIAISVAAGGPTWAEWIVGLTETQVLDIDFGETDRHFISSKGGAIADDPGDNIGLALDSGSWGGLDLAAMLSAQSEGHSDATLSNSTTDPGVSGSTGTVTYTDDTLTISRLSSEAAGWSDASVAIGAWYYVPFRVVSGTAFFRFSASSAELSLTAGTYSYIYRAADTDSARWWPATNATIVIDSISIKRLPGNQGIQATSNLQGKRQTGGVCRYDGSDDNHLTTFLAQNGAMTLLYHGTVAASIAATQMPIGASGSGANRCWLAITTAGYIAAGVGAQSSATIVGTTDVRGKTIVAGVTFDGSTVKLLLLVDGVTTEEYSAAQDSTPTTSVPFRIGAYNNNGTAAGFAQIDAKSLKAAHKAMTLAEFTSIAADLAA